MHPDDEKLLRIAKEIVIKFIELGRVSLSNFEPQFKSIFWALKNTVVDARLSDLEGELSTSSKDDSQDS